MKDILSSVKIKRSDIRCFLIIPFDKEFRPVLNILKGASEKVGCQIISLDEIRQPVPWQEIVPSEMARADLVVADVSQPRPNVFYEIGLAHAMGKPVILLLEEGTSEPPSALRRFPYLSYDKTSEGLAELQYRFQKLIEDFRQSPRRFRPFSLTPPGVTQPSFIVDLEKLEAREFENLCFELLNQMGFSRVKWEKGLREIDAVATLPKKDPDGYEYQELWFISMGLHAPIEMILEMAMEEPEYFFHRLLRDSDVFEERSFRNRPDVPITLLLILQKEGPSTESLEDRIRHMEKRLKQREYPFTLRVRMWDHHYLANLVQQYPQIGYKYFSEEERARSKYRKTPEELYEENVKLTERLQVILNDLREERDKRVRAERDAVWKDVAFKAAHKLGNPVYAIETDLQSLKKRIKTTNSNALQIAKEIGESLEKAKSIIEQFKSLTKVGEISLHPIDIVPLVQNACRIAKENGIKVEFHVPDKSPQVMADSNRMTECFDELVTNALHWFDKSEKKIIITVSEARKDKLPENLEQTKGYLRVCIEDNGCGVPLDRKEEIFIPFYTTHPHGTGIGLSLVQRLIEAHSGIIQEIGKPGKGASFEIYIPIATKKE
ncbi:MAG: ATP-binding protein [bacterium]|nr:ATP-binding protein [bacterium]